MLVTQCVQVILHKLTHSQHITAAIFSHAHAWLALAHAPTAHRTGPAWACQRRAPDQRAYSSCTPGHYIANDGIDWKLCVRIVLELYYSHSHCEWYTLIKRQCCDWLLSVASWTFALISYETVTVRDTQCSVSSADQTWSSAILRPALAAPLCGPTCHEGGGGAGGRVGGHRVNYSGNKVYFS